MNKFHSTVSRREFMKGLGLAGVGLGASALVAPQFHDLDELMSAPTSMQKRPWYVKERDLMNPTIDIDWGIMKRFNRDGEAHSRRVDTMFYTAAQVDAAAKFRKEIDARRLKNQEPGFGLKFQGLLAARDTNATELDWGFTGLQNQSDWAKTPEERGVPKYTGSPEENSRMLTAALRYIGMSFVGYNELDDTWRNKIVMLNTTAASKSFTYSPSNPTPPATDELLYVFENVPKPYAELHKGSKKQDAGKMVIPNIPLSVVCLSNAHSREAVQTTQSVISKSNSSTIDNFHDSTAARFFNFVRALGGYQVFGVTGHQEDAFASGATAVLTGIAESSRQNLYTLTPEMGSIHSPYNLFTDLPLAPTKPIDAGMFRFCHTCFKCANGCPSGSISKAKEPTFEVPLKDGKPAVWSNPGPKSFWGDFNSCHMYYTGHEGQTSGCWVCYANCTFTEDSGAMIHSVVKGTLSTTGIFNSFFATMHDTFGYGSHDPEEWWDMSLPVHGFDSTMGAGKGGYWKNK
ncbi:MAG: reductive dehalogenase [Dehalogenimonas sp.]